MWRNDKYFCLPKDHMAEEVRHPETNSPRCRNGDGHRLNS
jgi:hypothetical protein